MGKSQTTLFVDWVPIEKGALERTYDPELMSEAGRKWAAEMKRDFGRTFNMSGHGMVRAGMPCGVRVAPEKPSKSSPWLMADQPWEAPDILWVSVLHDDGRYRCWYEITVPEQAEIIYQDGRGMNLSGQVLCYAESEDGAHWTKPTFDIHTHRGRPTNIVAPFDSTNVFRDDSAPPDERYKCFDFDRIPADQQGEPPTSQYGLYGGVSPDGCHWTRLEEPLLRYFHDTHNIGTWDAEAGKYRAYLRGHLGGRAVAFSETTDFRHWPPANVFLHPGPEDLPATDYYNNSFTTYPGIPGLRFLFVSLFHHHNDLTAVRMAVSRNGTAFNWVSRDPVLEVGSPGEWDCGHIYAGPNLLHLPDGRLALPYVGGKLTHEGGLRRAYRDDYPFDDDAKLAWAIWEDGRLAGIEADDVGEFWTVAQFDGRDIEINARTIGAGKIEVELGEPDGSGWNSRPIPGFTFDDCIPFTGDDIWTTLRWKGHRDLSSLRGRLLVPHIRLTNGKIFGYRFVG